MLETFTLCRFRSLVSPSPSSTIRCEVRRVHMPKFCSHPVTQLISGKGHTQQTPCFSLKCLISSAYKNPATASQYPLFYRGWVGVPSSKNKQTNKRCAKYRMRSSTTGFWRRWPRRDMTTLSQCREDWPEQDNFFKDIQPTLNIPVWSPGQCHTDKCAVAQDGWDHWP